MQRVNSRSQIAFLAPKLLDATDRSLMFLMRITMLSVKLNGFRCLWISCTKNFINYDFPAINADLFLMYCAPYAAVEPTVVEATNQLNQFEENNELSIQINQPKNFLTRQD